MKRHFGKWLTAAALAVGCTVMTANAFADTDGHWAESAINKWSGEYGIIQGYDDGTFRPDKSITRGAFAGILDRFLHFQNASPADTFSDTAGTYWEDAILKLHASGIYLGNQGAALPLQHHHPAAGGGYDRPRLPDRTGDRRTGLYGHGPDRGVRDGLCGRV